MKIVHLCLSSVFIDGYSYQENLLPKYHKILGHTVTVVASLLSFDSFGSPCLLEGESVKINSDDVKVVRIDYKRPFYRINKFLRIYSNLFITLKNEKPDMLFIHDFSFLDIVQVLRYKKYNPTIEIIVDCHTDYINSAKSIISKYLFHHFVWRFFAKLLSPHVKVFYGVTPLRCDFLKNAYKINIEKVDLLVMGVDDFLLKKKNFNEIKHSISSKFQIEEDSFVIVTGGKIDSKKNIHLLIRAFLEINNPKLILLIFGTVSKEYKLEFDNIINLNRNIKFAGWLNSNEILDYLIYSDLIIFPGTHSVLWEQAVAIGKPCIFKYWEGMTHVDIGGNCEFLLNDSVDDIKNKINGLFIDGNKKLDYMRSRANNHEKFKFYYSEIAHKTLK
jgi:1,2-diacylglycerol 3-alpha-glucosyltransferase